jgi:hypothetical protein
MASICWPWSRLVRRRARRSDPPRPRLQRTSKI